MQFLNPLVLFGLAAASIPLLLHLFQRRKLKPVEISTLRFLRALQKTTVRRLKLRQILLLILRTLFIAFVVLAFARPALRGTLGGIGGRARTSVVVLLDNAMSMDARGPRGQLFAAAQQDALQILGALEEDDEAAVITMADTMPVDLRLTHDRALLRRTVAGARLAAGRARVTDAVRAAALLLTASHNPNKEVYVVSDLQRSSFDSLTNVTPLFDGRTQVVLVSGGGEGHRTENLSVDSLDVTTAVVEPGHPVTTRVTVRNHGDRDVAAATVRLAVNGRAVAQRTAQIPARGAATLELAGTIDATGVIDIAASVDDDAIPMDNERHAAVLVPPALHVALIGAAPERAFLRAAALPSADASSFISIAEIDPDRLGSVNFLSYDAVVFTSLPALSVGDAARLKSYLEAGGGAVVFGGGAATDFNANAAAAGLPRAETIAPDHAVRFARVDAAGPFFAGVFQNGAGDAAGPIGESPALTRYVRFGDDGKNVPVITLDDGTVFLARRSVGRGRVVLCGGLPTGDGGDFPFRPIFVPIVTRSLLIAGMADPVRPSLTAGDAEDVTIGGDAASVTIVAPDGAQARAVARPAAGGRVIEPGDISRCGVYAVRNTDGEAVGAFAVNPDRAESDLQSFSSSDALARLLPATGDASRLRAAPAGESITASISALRYGLELWRYCVYAALLCALLEMIVARTARAEAPEE